MTFKYINKMKSFAFLVLTAVICLSLAAEGKECGTNRVNPVTDFFGRIVGGHEAAKGSWPWQILLQKKSFEGIYQNYCGGSILNNGWILTAAHCVDEYDPKDYKVIVGEYNLEVEEGTELTVEVEKFIVHEKWDMATITNDVALLKLKTPLAIETNDYLNSVCLPENIDTNFEGRMCVATGWGKMNLQGETPAILHEVAIPIYEQEACREINADINLVTDDMICAGIRGGQKGGCHGDSGGPLVCKVNNKWHLVGVTSWAHACSFTGYPTVFARVSYFTEWINDKIANN